MMMPVPIASFSEKHPKASTNSNSTLRTTRSFWIPIKLTYNIVLKYINTHTGRNHFLDAPDGTEKAFLLNLFLAKLQHNHSLAITVASIGIGSTFIDNGWTAHFTFEMHFNVAHQNNPTCHIMHSLDESTIMKKYKNIVCDDATMSHKCSIQALDTRMRDLRLNNNILEGMTNSRKRNVERFCLLYTKEFLLMNLMACLGKKSLIWFHVQSKQLTVNVRLLLHTSLPTT